MIDEVRGKVTERITRAIHERVMPGAVLGVVTRSGERMVFPFGRFTYDEHSLVVTEDTMYDVASVTKSIPGAMLMLHLLDEGKIFFDDPLIKFVPEFATDEKKKQVTLRHILTYTLDLDIPAMATLITLSPDDIARTIITAKLKSVPGSRYVYANSTAFFMSLIIERVTGKPVDQLADELFFAPLGMRRTTFHPERYAPESFPPTEIVDWRGGEVRGVVHDESTFMLQRKFMPAIAGLFSTAPDLLTFLEMLLRGGEKEGRRYFSEEMIKLMTTNHTHDIAGHGGLGWEVGEEYFMGRHAKEVYGKTGFTGCAVEVAPELGIAFVLLSNATYPKRKDRTDGSKNALRSDIADIVFRM